MLLGKKSAEAPPATSVSNIIQHEQSFFLKHCKNNALNSSALNYASVEAFFPLI